MIRAAVLGEDVSKSRSPAIHLAAFTALGVDGSYEAFSVDAAGFDARVAALRDAGYRYLNVTIPHKLAAAKLAGAQGPEVRVSHAANTLIFEADAIRAENTDGAGLIAALGDLGFSPGGNVVVSSNTPGDAQPPFAFPQLVEYAAGTGAVTMSLGNGTGFLGFGLGVGVDGCGNAYWASFANEPSLLDPHTFLAQVAL